jgi:hypothetical protein
VSHLRFVILNQHLSKSRIMKNKMQQKSRGKDNIAGLTYNGSICRPIVRLFVACAPFLQHCAICYPKLRLILWPVFTTCMGSLADHPHSYLSWDLGTIIAHVYGGGHLPWWIWSPWALDTISRSAPNKDPSRTALDIVSRHH